MNDIIDFDAGRVISGGASLNDLFEELIDLIIELPAEEKKPVQINWGRMILFRGNVVVLLKKRYNEEPDHILLFCLTSHVLKTQTNTLAKTVTERDIVLIFMSQFLNPKTDLLWNSFTIRLPGSSGREQP